MSEDWKADTQKHIERVAELLGVVMARLHDRAMNHDTSKIEEPEASGFAEFTPKLAGSTYDSPEYKQFLVDMKPFLDHHYENNPHHPEHFSAGILNMTLVDLVEMFCDWVAATERHDDGDIFVSISKNQTRFKMSPQVAVILENTARMLGKVPKHGH